MKRGQAVFALAAVAALAFACAGGGTSGNAGTATPRPVPPKVTIRDEPEGVGLADPAFEALPGAKAYYGHLGGTVYRIEIPDDWNGRLLLYQHGFQNLAAEAEVNDPLIRTYLIRNGWAWAASSYSSTSLIPGRAADETAALWDYFVQNYGQPDRTYVTGESMGGAATNIAAERYGDRYDGALQMCGFAGQPAITSIVGDFFYAGAYVAGVTQAELDAALGTAETPASGEVPTQPDLSNNSLTSLIETKIKPALEDPERHSEFQSILLDLTGGPRAFDREGFDIEEASNWERASLLVSLQLAHNEDVQYELGPLSKTSTADFNAGVVRNAQNSDQAFLNSYYEGNDITGDLQMPLLTMQTTGDWQVPIDQQQLLRRKVEAAGGGDQLVERAVRDRRHCGFTLSEWQQGLEDLVDWVEQDKKPKGEDLLVDDLTKVGGTFTLAPRYGSPDADSVAGADERVTVAGTVTLNGQPIGDGAYVYPIITKDNMERAYCMFLDARTSDGRYESVVASETEVPACGAPATEVYLGVYDPDSDQYYTSDRTIAWPADGNELRFDAVVTTDGVGREGGLFYGVVGDANGKDVPPRTLIEAYSGDTLCGVSTVSEVVMAYAGPATYDLAATSDACAENAPLTFKIGGKPAMQTGTNSYDGYRQLDLTVQE